MAKTEPLHLIASTFIKGQTDRLSINPGDEGEFSSMSTMAKQKGEDIFEKGGHQIVYVPLDAKYSSSFLSVKPPETNACLMMHFVPLPSKAEALGKLSNLDLSKPIAQ
ncbi:MAG: hypothetical protein K9G58_13835 [Bacteroidales bacterium]|nr:hypothetical protein [Bacteroidales bacterium]MCF8399251.1 hypothetical protein [Bacteroidales bacterium]